MAQGHVHLDTETFSCPLCLDLLKDPVSLACGHNYCLSCITHHWDTEDGKGIHSCPQCRREFTARPELRKNTTLAAVVEQVRKTGVQAAPADHCYAGAEDVACDVCTGRKLKALKSCLVCLVSYCESHLQPHLQSPAFAKHQLVEPSKKLRDNICSHHGKLIEMFCRSDQQCICLVCCIDQHKGHDIVSAAAERSEKQKKLPETQQSIQQRIQDREGELKELQQEVKEVKLSADEAVEHSKKIYTELIRLVEERSCEVEQLIRSQQESEVRRLQELEEKLQQELSELRSKAAELQQLSHTEDHCSFLHHYSSASSQAASTGSGLRICPGRRFEEVTAAVSDSSQTIQWLLRDTWTNISPTEVELSPAAEPTTREEFLGYSAELTLDPNIAHTHMLLSEGNTRATVMKENQPRPHHPDRFRGFWCQVLSKESLTGRRYWEVKVREGRVVVAVADKNISRAGAESAFGNNDKSWALRCDNQSYGFWFNGVKSEVSGPWSDTVGVYLDHAAGLLSFYSVSDSMTLLHTVHTSFTQPLHAGLMLRSAGSSCELAKLG